MVLQLIGHGSRLHNYHSPNSQKIIDNGSICLRYTFYSWQNHSLLLCVASVRRIPSLVSSCNRESAIDREECSVDHTCCIAQQEQDRSNHFGLLWKFHLQSQWKPASWYVCSLHVKKIHTCKHIVRVYAYERIICINVEIYIYIHRITYTYFMVGPIYVL